MISPKRRSVLDEEFLVVRTLASDMRGGTLIEEHAHSWHQLIAVIRGLVVVRTEIGSWVAPNGWAIWAPAGQRHAISFVRDCALRTLYVQAGWRDDLPAQCTAIAVTPLLRALILYAIDQGMLDRRDRVEEAAATLIAAQIRQAGPPPFALVEPTSAAMTQAARLLRQDTPGGWDLPRIAGRLGMGLRTFERRFRMETGLPPGSWRNHDRMFSGLAELAAGTPIKAIASSCGYRSVSAYTASFRTIFGTTPARYFADDGIGGPD